MPRIYTRIDHTGRTYGKFTALAFVDMDKGYQRYRFRCVCGTEKVLRVHYVKSGTVSSCGCSKQREDVTGRSFGPLTAIKYLGMTNDGQQRYRFACECGGQTDARLSHVKSGQIKGCGCRIGKHTKHGEWIGDTPTPEWLAWSTMRGRCLNPTHRAYPSYGGRGITICDRWLTFETFLADMGRRPSSGHSLDRIDNDGSYEPGNCRWATKKWQSRNRRVVRIVEYRGEAMCVAEAIERSQSPLAANAVIKRLNRGWLLEDALSRPAKPKRR